MVRWERKICHPREQHGSPPPPPHVRKDEQREEEEEEEEEEDGTNIDDDHNDDDDEYDEKCLLRHRLRCAAAFLSWFQGFLVACIGGRESTIMDQDTTGVHRDSKK